MAQLFDEASRPGNAEYGGDAGNSNPWDQIIDEPSTQNSKDLESKDGVAYGRWDPVRGIPSAGKLSGEGFGPVENSRDRTLVYRLSTDDCLKCLSADDCVPNCLLDGNCVGEAEEQGGIPVDSYDM